MPVRRADDRDGQCSRRTRTVKLLGRRLRDRTPCCELSSRLDFEPEELREPSSFSGGGVGAKQLRGETADPLEVLTERVAIKGHGDSDAT